MNPTQLVLGVYLTSAAGGYLMVRGVLARRTRPAPPRIPAPPDPMAPDLASMLPALSETRRDLQKMLWTAGRYRPSALTEYLAIRAVLFIGALLATGLLALLAPASQLPSVLAGGAIVAALAFSLPRVILGAQARARARRLVIALPLAMDVIGLCLTAGQNLLSSLEQTSRHLAGSCPDLALELQIIGQQARMHSLEQALLQWAERLDVSEVRSLALLLVQSDRLGTDMVNTLLEGSDSQRTLLRQRVEAQANRTNFWMLFPTLFCLWTASAIILVGPVYIEFWNYRAEQVKALVGNAKGQVERSNTPTLPATSPGETPTAATVPATSAGPQ
jgi:tight adherence protein C